MTAAALALAFRQPILALDKEKECDELAAKVAKVMSHYGDIPGLNERTLDWLAMFYTAGIIVGPRVMMLKAQRPPKPDTPQPSSARPAAQPDPNMVEIPGVGKVQVM